MSRQERRTERCPLCGGAPFLDVDPCMGQLHTAHCSDCFDGEPDMLYTIQGCGPTADWAVINWLERATEVAERLVARDARMFEEVGR